jgi:hypothetical protein
MTESNTNDRRFWMVISSIVNLDTKIESFDVIKSTDGASYFYDQKAADIVASEYSSLLGGNDEVYMVEAVSRYTVPAPKVVKQNLHIPPITAREERPND